MDGLCEITPACVPIAIDGSVWRLGPLRLADYAEMERHVLRNRRPMEAVRARMQGQPEQMQRDLLRAAFDEVRRAARATKEELQTWLRSPAGILFEFWLRVRSGRSNATLDWIEKSFADRTVEISGTMATAARTTGEYPLGNWPGRPRRPTHPAAAKRFLGGVFSAA